jgi:MobA-like NTP transferase domain
MAAAPPARIVGPKPLAAAILSAGESRRMGSPKALIPYRGTTFAGHLLEVVKHPRIGIVRIVLGAGADKIRERLQLDPATIVLNPEWPTLVNPGCDSQPAAGCHRGPGSLPCRPPDRIRRARRAADRGIRFDRQADRATHVSRPPRTSRDFSRFALRRATRSLARCWRAASRLGASGGCSGSSHRRKRHRAESERPRNAEARDHHFPSEVRFRVFAKARPPHRRRAAPRGR